MMLRRLGVLVCAGVLGLAGLAHADEGMWMLHQIPELDQAKLKAMGLRLDPKQIWDPASRTGLAAAVVSLGGCSASFVSPQGLIVTNHHCAFRAVQSAATPEHDYIEEGFLAPDRAGEVRAAGYHVYVFDGYDDVTAKIRAALTPKMTPDQRAAAIETAEKDLIAGCEKTGFRCRVADTFGGLHYYLFRTLDLRDVRLVYAPPRSIGEYGGEIDNWMWPRHTGDFSFLRAYVGPDGKPADYAENNVPYQPRTWLKLATDPLREGDFAFILGYPGRTKRYELSTAVASDTATYYPERNEVYGRWIEILESYSKQSKAAEIALASKIKGFANSYKNGEGMLDGLRKLHLADAKRAEEDQLAAWIAADPERAARWGDVLPAMRTLLASHEKTASRDFLLGAMGRGASVLGAALTITRWAAERAKPDAQRDPEYQQRNEANARQRLAMMDRSLDVPADKAVLVDILQRAEKLGAGARITAFDDALAATGKSGDAAVTALVDRLYSGTSLAGHDERMAMFAMSSEQLAARHDPMIDLALALRPQLDANEAANKAFDGEWVTLEPRYIEALEAFRKAPLYPDANSTLRLTYGTVKGYSPRDAVLYLPFTTLSGVVEKNTGEAPFACPKSLLDAYRAGDRGPYEDAALHDVPSCFLTTHDTTGGNSGSPIMNGRGQLVGLLFDGTIESMTSDYAFDPAITRSIGVDIRYMLWVMDYVDHAHWLMQEMGITPVSR